MRAFLLRRSSRLNGYGARDCPNVCGALLIPEPRSEINTPPRAERRADAQARQGSVAPSH